LEELLEYAEYLGIKIPGDEKYLDIAREGISHITNNVLKGLKAELP